MGSNVARRSFLAVHLASGISSYKIPRIKLEVSLYMNRNLIIKVNGVDSGDIFLFGSCKKIVIDIVRLLCNFDYRV